MPFLLFVILAGLLGSSVALRAECVGLAEDLWDFGNRWLRRLIIGTALWSTLMVVVAGIGPWGTFTVGSVAFGSGIAFGVIALLIALLFWVNAVGARRWIVPTCCLAVAVISFTMVSMKGDPFTPFNGPAIALVLGFGPTIAFVIAWAQQPMLVAVPSIVNAVESGLEQALGSVPLPKKYKPSVTLPRVPDIKRILWPFVAFAVISLLFGIYLWRVPVWNSLMLLIVLLALGIAIAWLSVFDKWKKLRGILQVAAVVVTAIICLGGEVHAKSTLKEEWNKLVKPDESKYPGYVANRLCAMSAESIPPTESATDVAALAVTVPPRKATNFFGLKWMASEIEKRHGGEDSGVSAPPDVDGKVYNWAEFPSIDDERQTVKEVVQSYGDITLDQALRKYSTGKEEVTDPPRPGYDGGAILRMGFGDRLSINQKVPGLSDAQWGHLIDLIQKLEGDSTPAPSTTAAATAIFPMEKIIRPNQSVTAFSVEFREDPLEKGKSCFAEWVHISWPGEWRYRVIRKGGHHQGWIAFWFDGERESTQAYGEDDHPYFDPTVLRDPHTFRVAGKIGDKVVFFRNVYQTPPRFAFR